MTKILVMENTNVLNLRIISIFSRRRDVNVENIQTKMVNIQNLLKDANHLIIDIDNFEGNLKTLLTKIRHGMSNAEIPITLMSSNTDKTMIYLAAQFKDIEILVKPFSDIDLLKKVLRSKKPPLIKDIVHENDTDNSFKLKWSDEYKIGVESIDNEHKQIVDNFENLYLKIKEGSGLQHYEEMLHFIEKYVSVHFSHEEKLQKDIGYVNIENHINEHRHFQIQLNQFIENQQNNTISNKDLVILVMFIKEWIIHHILIEDKKIGDFLESNE